MNIVEGMSVRVTPAPKRVRKLKGYWNRPELIEVIDRVLATGKEETLCTEYTLYVVKPEYASVSQTPEYIEKHEKIRVAEYNLAYTFHVEKGDTVPFPAEELYRIVRGK
jgi:hypothetical protein